MLVIHAHPGNYIELKLPGDESIIVRAKSSARLVLDVPDAVQVIRSDAHRKTPQRKEGGDDE
jgi:hypothetical protein